MRVDKRLGKVMVITMVLSILTILSVGMSVVAQDDGLDQLDMGEFWFCTGTLFCILPIVIFIVSLLIAIWVYKDAEKRGKSGALWLIIVLLSGIIGLIIWFVVRPKEIVRGPGGPPPQQPGYPPQQPYYPPQQPGYPPQQPPYQQPPR